MTEETSFGWQPEDPIRLLEKLKFDLKYALRSKNDALRDAIRQIMAEFPRLTMPVTLSSGKKSFRLKTQEEITNDDVLGIIRSLIKSEKVLLEAKQQATSEYLVMLTAYLPRPASPEEILAWIRENHDLSAIKNAKQLMGPVMKHFGFRVESGQVQAILKELIPA